LALELESRALERLAPEPIALRLQRIHLELEIAAIRIDRELPERGDLHPVIRRRGNAPNVTRPDNTSDLCLRVAKTEVPLAVPMRLEVAHLAAHPERHERAFEHILRSPSDRVDRNGRLRAC